MAEVTCKLVSLDDKQKPGIRIILEDLSRKQYLAVADKINRNWEEHFASTTQKMTIKSDHCIEVDFAFTDIARQFIDGLIVNTDIVKDNELLLRRFTETKEEFLELKWAASRATKPGTDKNPLRR